MISVKSGAFLSTHEEVVNQNNGYFHNTDTIYLFNDWTNIAGNEAFNSIGKGIVHLYGDNQYIKGTDITRFYDLRAEQTGVKFAYIDVYVDGYLRLFDRRFHVGSNTISVFNTDLDAVENIGLGYVSAVTTGGLLRHTALADAYHYPVGWPNYYRPLTLTINSSNINEFKVRMAMADASTEGFDRELREPFLCEINPVYYHRIYRESGNDAIKIKYHYDIGVDGDWNTITHFQNLPQWEDTGDETSGVDAISGLDYYESVDYINDFTYPAFALGDNSDTLLLTASDTTVCDGETVTFTAESGYIFYDFYLNGVSVQASPSNTYINNNLQNGDVISYIATANECQYNSTEVVMTIYPLPNPTASSNSPICEFLSINLNANGGVSYEWSGPNGFNSNEQNPSINNANPLYSGIYTVTATDINGCTNTATTEVLVYPAPIPTINSNAPICDNETLFLFSTGGISYEWSGPNNFTSIEQNPFIENTDIINEGIYTVTITDELGCTNSISTNIIIYNLPNPSASNNGPICFGETLNLNATGGITYFWEGPLGYIDTVQNPIIINANPLSSGIYTVTVTDINGCTNTASTEAIINPLPDANIDSNSPICQSLDIQFNASGGIQYEWEGPNGFNENIANPVISNAQLIHEGVYTVTVTDINTCVNTATENITVLLSPSVSITSNSPICINETLEFNVLGGLTHIWEGPNGFNSSLQNPEIENIQLINSGIYTVTISDSNGCTNTASTSIIVNDLPTASAQNNSPICEFETINLFAQGGSNYQWQGPNGFNSNEQNPSINNANSLYSGIYTVTVVDNNSCQSTATTEVVIYNLPDGIISNDSPACIGDNVQLNVTDNPNYTYQWSGPNGFNETINNPIITNAQIEDTGTYTVTITDQNSCTVELNTIVAIGSYPDFELSSNAPLCEGNDVYLNAPFNNSWDYFWEGPNSFNDTIYNPVIEDAYNINEGEYSLTVFNSFGCATTESIEIELYDGVNTNPYNDTVFIYETTSTLIGIPFDSTYTYQWLNDVDCNTCNENIVSPSENTTYTIVVTSENGCTDTFTITVIVLPRGNEELVLPNTITPNEDGYNDMWIIPWLDRYQENAVVIVNRWGDEVFKARPYQNDFNGTYNGKELPAGVYYFILNLGEDFQTFSGPLTIIRE